MCGRVRGGKVLQRRDETTRREKGGKVEQDDEMLGGRGELSSEDGREISTPKRGFSSDL